MCNFEKSRGNGTKPLKPPNRAAEIGVRDKKGKMAVKNLRRLVTGEIFDTSVRC